ncbi:Glycosyltransferase involved in cell wall bisynthesis [Lachnospiraceae bacterium XBB2008]|nr:Glycosyltransferase involved in cell wall bisynthesis [Lachnospiraceae bacterium XBB2008]
MENASVPYILEVSWGCPSEKYPIHGVFQFDQAYALREAGERVVFLALDLRSIRRWRKWGVNRATYRNIPVYEYNFPCGPMPPAIKYRIQDHGFKKAIRAIVRDHGQPALIHIHTCQQAISETSYCAEHDIPYFITEHITPLDETPAIEERKRDALRGAARVIAVSDALGWDLKCTYGVDSITIPNIVDLSEFRYDPEQRENHSGVYTDSANRRTTRFISAASVNYGKGFDILIRAYAELIKTNPDTHLTVMGDGPEMSTICDLTGELGISVSGPEETTDTPGTITFTGSYHRRDFAEALARSDIFVLPSRSETFGLVYAEALAAGVPVIATRCGGPEDFIDDSNGILVPVDDVQALAEAMRSMADKKKSFDRASISESCKGRFAPDVIARRIIDVLMEYNGSRGKTNEEV